MTKSLLLPDVLKNAIDDLLSSTPTKHLVKAAGDLSSRYRGERTDLNKPYQAVDFMNSNVHRLAYLAVRMPATFAVVKRVLDECSDRMPDFHPQSLADIGAGPGTASFAALEAYPNLQKISLYEKDKDLSEIGFKLMNKEMQHPALKHASWHFADLNEGINLEKNDLTVLSYVVGELSITSGTELVKKAWADTDVLVLIEPGTPHGFSRILQFRSLLLELGAHIVAPCPHQKACPMAGKDWCHFSIRLERSSLHREIKDVEMGHEDEKYSYIIASKTSTKLPDARLPEARILRHPQVHSGHVDFVLCEASGQIKKSIISKRMGGLYKKARKLDWGDVFPPKELNLKSENGSDL